MNKELSNEYINKDMLRFTTAGSVDDGKSTLIGRLLYDSKSIFADQMDALESASKLRGEDCVNLALLTDGLRAEREQGITIDVAYRYFATPTRKFIIADTPGHEQYTRNMVTGASTADLAIVLIDARNGVSTQSRRHGFLASLLGISHLLVAVNKMDLVDYSEDVFNKIKQEYLDFSAKLNVHDITFVPISALNGDNVVNTSDVNMPWYEGVTVLHYLENVTVSADRNLVDFRFPVQSVIRPHQNFRGFAGRVASGTIKKGEEIIALPSGTESKIKEIIYDNKKQKEAFESQSVVLTLEDEIDISRGEMIVRKNNVPHISSKIEATVCWMDNESPLKENKQYVVYHGTKQVQAIFHSIRYKININTLHREKVKELNLNEIGRVQFETSSELFFDAYDDNRKTGCFIIVDIDTNRTVGAGIIKIEQTKDDVFKSVRKATNIKWEEREVSLAQREERNGHKGHVYWLTGLSGSGKTAIAKQVEKAIFAEGKQVYLLDGDNVRHGLNEDLGFSETDRMENIRRIARVAELMYHAGFIVICTFISPDKKMRDFVRSLFNEKSYSEIYIKCDIEECKKRDPKALYEKAVKGEILNFTGISAPYDEPKDPEHLIETDKHSLLECIEKVMEIVKSNIDR